MTGFIHFAIALNGDKAGQELAGDEIARLISAPDLAWVHMRAESDGTRAWIETNLTYLDRPAIDALLAEETRPRVQEIGKGALIILRGVNHNEGADPEDMVSIRLWVDENRIISVSKRGLKSVADLHSRIRTGQGPTEAGAFVTALVERLSTRIEAFRRDLDEATDTLEETVIQSPDQAQRHKIMETRLATILFRRYISPQRDELSSLLQSTLGWLRPADIRHLHEAHNNLVRIVEDLDAIRDRLQILKDELSSITADRMNRNMYLLSVVAALFLPLGFLTGLFGINLAGMPGQNWDMGFWVFVGAMVGVGIGQLLILRLLKLF